MYCLNVVSVVFLLLGWVVFCLISRKPTTVSQMVILYLTLFGVSLDFRNWTQFAWPASTIG